MLAILSDRNRIMQKKELESNNAEWNWSKGFAAGCSSEVIERGAEQLS